MEKKGEIIQPTSALCARNFSKPMYNLAIQLCYYCIQNNSKRDFFETNGKRISIKIQLCQCCAEFNQASQKAGEQVVQEYCDKRLSKRKAEEITRQQLSINTQPMNWEEFGY